MRRATVSLFVASWLCALPAKAGLSSDFFAFDNGAGRDQKLPYPEQAALLRKTGYSGMAVYSGTARIGEMLQALDSAKLRLLSVYVHSYVDGRAESIDPGIPDAARQLAGRETMLLLTVQGRGPDAEKRAVENVQRVADLAAQHGVRVCLYPHINFYVETTADALRIVRKAARKNVGVALNLYHTVAFHLARCGSEDFDMARLIRDAMPHLYFVSINGIATNGSEAGLMRLDLGNYDGAHLLSLLDRAGYAGPVGLQCYQVPGDLQENLARSMAAWRGMLTSVRHVRQKNR